MEKKRKKSNDKKKIKAVISHVKEDIGDYKHEIAKDKSLLKKIKRKRA